MAEDVDVGVLHETALGEVILPTFRVLARLRSITPDDAGALADARARLAGVADSYDELRVERREEDGSAWVVARFVTVSVDAHTAVLGVHDLLAAGGASVDEVWVDAPPVDGADDAA